MLNQEIIDQSTDLPEITIDREDGADKKYIEFKRNGFGFHFMSDVLVSIHFQSGRNNSEYSKYLSSLPMNINFDHSKLDIKTLLGKPEEIGGGEDDFLGTIPDWFKYKFDDFSLHVEFDQEDGKVQILTLMNYD